MPPSCSVRFKVLLTIDLLHFHFSLLLEVLLFLFGEEFVKESKRLKVVVLLLNCRPVLGQRALIVEFADLSQGHWL
jgi:hypothetical protein